MFLRKNWLPLLFCVVMICAVSFYILTTQTHKEPIKTYKPVEVSSPANPKPPPPGETAESGHWHGDEWHAEPHSETPEVSAGAVSEPHTPQNAADITTEVRDTSLMVQPANGQIGAPTQETSQPTQEADKVFYGPHEWGAWFKKEVELSEKLTQVQQKLADALSAIDAETEAEYKREMRRIFAEIDAEMTEALRLHRAHQEKEPVSP